MTIEGVESRKPEPKIFRDEQKQRPFYVNGKAGLFLSGLSVYLGNNGKIQKEWRKRLGFMYGGGVRTTVAEQGRDGGRRHCNPR